MIRGRDDVVFDTVNYVLLGLITLTIAYPLYFTIIASFSDPDLVNLGRVWIIPTKPSVLAYINVLKSERVWLGYCNSFVYMTLGTFINLALVLTASYGLSRKGLVGRGLLTGIFVFTMYFSGGLIPTFLLIKKLGIVDTRWAMVLPWAVGVWYMIICRTFYQSAIPVELYEAAKIDGASDAAMFLRIVLPLSKPIIAVLALYFAVAHWNEFFAALVYLPRSRDLHPLQMVLREILIQNQQMSMDVTGVSTEQMAYMAQAQKMAESMKYALIIIASAPLLIMYPFAQRYFVQGVLIGSLKG